jgi:hypothetical protein
MARLMRLLVVLTLVALPSLGRAASVGSGSGDAERKDEDVAKPAPAPQAAVEPAPKRALPKVKDYVPATQSVTVDVGGAVDLLGGWAYPKVALYKSRPDTGFYAHGIGGGMKLHWDFTAQDLDWRLGLDGTLPRFAAFEATVGVRRDLSPWQNPRILLRAAGGVEMMYGGAEGKYFLAPTFVGKGEAVLEFTLIDNLLSLGAGFEIGVRYGLPLGVGFDFGSFIRTEIWF